MSMPTEEETEEKKKKRAVPWFLIALAMLMLAVIVAAKTLVPIITEKVLEEGPSAKIQEIEEWEPDEETEPAVNLISYVDFQEYLYGEFRMAINTLRGDILDLQKKETQSENRWEAFKAHIVAAQDRHVKDRRFFAQANPTGEWIQFHLVTADYMDTFGSQLRRLRSAAESRDPTAINIFEKEFFADFNVYEEKYFKVVKI